METKNSKNNSDNETAAAIQAPAQAQAQASDSASTQTPPAPAEAPTTIKKGIYLSALIYIEGQQAPPDDFAGLTVAALKNSLNECFSHAHEGLTMALRSVDVQNNVEDESDEPDSGDRDKRPGDSSAHGGRRRLEEKFQF